MKKTNKQYWVSYALLGSGDVEVTASTEEDAKDKFDELPFEELLDNADFKSGIEIDDIQLSSDPN